MHKVCFDTNVMIWGFQKKAHPSHTHMIPRTRHLIETLENDKVILLVPSVVVGELLLGISETEYLAYAYVLARYLRVIPYDLRAAAKFAEIWNDKDHTGVVTQLKADGATKNALRADAMIVATAVTNNVDCIYSHDIGLKNFANGYLEVRDVPELPPQQTTYLDDED